MPKYTTTLFMALISIYSFAQKSVRKDTVEEWKLEKSVLKKLPFDLSYIPAKSFTSLVRTGNDSASSYRSRIVSVRSFYISQTEVTNKEYRDFVHYVRDSIAHTLLLNFKSENKEIDWKKNINWNDDRLDAMMIPAEERILGRKEIDPVKLNFEISYFGQKEIITVCPDTLRWLSDFSYSYNELLAKRYFSHSGYNNYPVVGVSLKQAMAFCQWKTKQVNANVIVRLPTNAEWESAAIGEKDTAVAFAGKKPYKCNFGTIPSTAGGIGKAYDDDGFFYTGPVKSFSSESYGLFDMKGNVAEWTSTALDEIQNVEVKAEKQKRLFIVKGGGWNSTIYYLQPGACQFYNAEAANTWTGFRYVVEVKKN
ncbi:MAG: SUMF1/EgtB/PvdO family nonheme iron enzyme [Chitinophagaceae bacterium]|nr:SUMF1/EgtB/PvdO family nonheme iron enzyme [Chitinophagaceae bacterium]